MATTTHVPVEVYLRSSYEPDAEYVDGEIEERPDGRVRSRVLARGDSGYGFRQHEKAWSIRVLPELRVKVAATRYRVPDVTLLDRGQPTEQIITHPPLAVFEILSPEDTLQRLKRGSKTTASWASRKSGSSTRRTALLPLQEGQLLRNDIFSHAGKGIAFDMNEIKNLLDE